MEGKVLLSKMCTSHPVKLIQILDWNPWSWHAVMTLLTTAGLGPGETIAEFMPYHLPHSISFQLTGPDGPTQLLLLKTVLGVEERNAGSYQDK